MGRTGLPSNFLRERVNEGSPTTQIFNWLSKGSEHSGQACPGMVGPLKDKKYYCLAKEYGYCDRRSGTCFCNVGYFGEDCSECSPTHVRSGGLCYPKMLCPDDCSGSGTCDYLTGVCDCIGYRTGANCATKLCTNFDDLCSECDTKACLKCVEGYSVDPTKPAQQQCQTCSRFDPRCLVCSPSECLHCLDPLLSSIRRSGPRRTDPPLPFDELDRELSITVPFGSLQSNAFDEGETFEVQQPSSPNVNLPLKDHSTSCDQGFRGDSSWNCTPAPTSHMVCGHVGTISFSSAEYEVPEDRGNIRITLRRTGGGVGEVSVKYAIEHVTSSDADVTPTHFYTTVQTVVFYPGEIEKSVVLTIHDNRVYESDRTFLVTLSDPSGGAVVGPQHRAIVTILDDDERRTSWGLSDTATAAKTWTMFESYINSHDVEQKRAVEMTNLLSHHRAVAGSDNVYTINAVSGDGAPQLVGGDEFLVELKESKYRASNDDEFNKGRNLQGHSVLSKAEQKLATDNGDGSYSVTFNTNKAGKYALHTYLVVPGGLTGYYYEDPYFSPDSLTNTRIDAIVNFTWGEGKITPLGTDLVSVWWGGLIKSDLPSSEDFFFTLDFDDNVRLYVDGLLIIDKWDRSGGSASGSFVMESGVYHDILIEYRDVRGNANVRLMWDSPSTPYGVVPSTNLFQKNDIVGSPFNYTVIADSPFGPTSTASGAGLFAGIAGSEHKFTIESRDLYDNFRGDFGAGYGGEEAFFDKLLADVAKLDGFVAVAKLTSDASNGGFGSSTVPATITYNTGTRLFEGTFVPTKAGDYELDVSLTEEQLGYWTETVSGTAVHIFGSPFTVTTSPAFTLPQQSDVYGGDGNCPTSLGAGTYDISGNQNGAGWASWVNSDCSGITHGLAGATQSFVINSRDVNHNDRLAWGDKWEVTAHSLDAKTAYIGWIEDGSTPGVYNAYVTPLTSGEYYLDVTINGVHAKGSPFELYVRHNDGYGPESHMLATLSEPWRTVSCSATTSFVVQVVDEFANKLESSAYPYDSTTALCYVTSDSNNLIIDASGTVTFLGDGTFSVSYVAKNVGDNKLNVLVNGLHITGSPFDITAIPGSFDSGSSTVTGAGLTAATAGIEATFVIQARDAKSNPRDASTDSFDIDIDMETLSARPAVYDDMNPGTWGSSESVSSVATYQGDGLFEVKYNATVSGTYKMTIKKSGSDIIGSPFYPVVAPTVASATESKVPGTGTRTGTAGVLEPVEIYTRDVFGNYLLNGGSKIHARVVLTSHHQSVWEQGGEAGGSVVVLGLSSEGVADPVESWTQDVTIQDFNNGRYKAHYVPAYSGDYKLTVTMDSPGGLWGSYYRSADFAESQLALIKHDVEIGFDWGHYSPVGGGKPPGISCVGSTGELDDPATTGFDESQCFGNGLGLPANHYSIIWNGYIEADHDEEYEVGLLCGSNSRGGIWVDEVEVAKFGDCAGADGKITGKVLMAAGRRAKIVVKYSHSTEASAVKLMWTSPSQGTWAPVPSSALHREIIMSDTVYTPVHVPDAADAQFSTATGASVTSAVAGIQQSFTVECRDGHGNGVWGNRRLAGGCAIQVVGRGASGGVLDAFVQGTVTDLNDGTYRVDYHPSASGSYYLSVTAITPRANSDLGEYYEDLSVVNAHVVGSPFLLVVVPGETTAAQTHIDINAAEDAIVHQESNVTVWSKDVEGNRKSAGGDKYEIFLAETGVGDTQGHVDGDKNVYGEVVDNGDGTYTGLYTPDSQFGETTYKLFVKLIKHDEGGNVASRTDVMGSPYGVVIWPDSPHPWKTRVATGQSTKLLVAAAPGGEVNSFNANSNSVRTFYVQTSDSFGNNWWVGGADFVARVRGDTRELAGNRVVGVTDIGDGRYKVEMFLSVAGNYEVDVLLANGVNSVGKSAASVGENPGGGGLTGRYYSNLHLLGEPSFTRVDSVIDFAWGQGLVTKTAVDYASIVWTGYVKAPYAEEVTFELFNVDDYARLWIEDELVVDTSAAGATTGTWTCRQNTLYKVRIEYFETDRGASVQLLWKSRSMQRHTIPKNYLFSSATAIQGSPYTLVVT